MSLLTLSHLSFTLPKLQKSILKDLSYTLAANDFVILLGSNGSGKSSLLKILTQQYSPSHGQIYFQGKNLKLLSRDAFSKKIAVLTQNPDDSLFCGLTIYENYLLANNANIKISNRQQRMQFKDYLKAYNPKLAQKLDDNVAKLSGGEKQALALALCFLNPPTLLLLDEHTSALDPKTSKTIMELTANKIKEHQITCILTTHDLDIALNYGNRILMLQEGEIHKQIESAEKAKLTHEKLVKHYYE